MTHRPWQLLKDADTEVYDIIEQELKRQSEGLEMIASENFTKDPGDDKKVIIVPQLIGDHVYELRPVAGATIAELRDMSASSSKWVWVPAATLLSNASMASQTARMPKISRAER